MPQAKSFHYVRPAIKAAILLASFTGNSFGSPVGKTTLHERVSFELPRAIKANQLTRPMVRKRKLKGSKSLNDYVYIVYIGNFEVWSDL